MGNQNALLKSEPVPNWPYRVRAFVNVLRMGHCAPASMQTILAVSATQKQWLVRLAAGMPGGIGNTGFECGGLTSPLVLLGLHFGLRQVDRGLPVIFDRGHALCRSFLDCQKTLKCKEIRGRDRFPLHCIPPVTRSPELFLAATHADHQQAIPAENRAAYAQLYAHLVENDFHCAQAVLAHLGYSPADDRQLFEAVSAFNGGMLFLGKTCSAFTAGVMVGGLRAGEIENSIPRVIRLLAIMTAGGNAFADRLNKFNPSMNWGYRLSKWFGKEFGSTQCQAITGCDFSSPEGVRRYIDSNQVAHCQMIAQRVAERVQSEVQDGVYIRTASAHTGAA